jgi:transposase-like protein
MARRSRYPKELLDRGVRLALEGERPIAHIARDLGVEPESLRKRVRQAQADAGARTDLLAGEEREEIRRLRRENFELRRANEILKSASGVFCQGARPRPTEVSAYIDQHRERFGVGPICRTLGVSASAYYQRATGGRSPRRVEDEWLTARIGEVHRVNYECYGYRRVHAALVREGESAGRDQVARLMAAAGVQGAKRRGKPWRTTTADSQAAKRPDLVKRNFTAAEPDQLWVGDLRVSALLGGPAVPRVHARRVLTPGDRLAARVAHAHRPRSGRSSSPTIRASPRS